MHYKLIILFAGVCVSLAHAEMAHTRQISVSPLDEQKNLQLQPGYAPVVEHEATKKEMRDIQTRTAEEELLMKHKQAENEVQIAARIEPVQKKVRAAYELEDRRKKVAVRLKELNEKVYKAAQEGGLAYENARKERDAFLASVSGGAIKLLPP